jgi:hypothetical protein
MFYLKPPRHISTLPNPPEYGDALLNIGIAFGDRHQDAKPPHTIWLLCPRQQRARGRRTADKSDELATSHVPLMQCFKPSILRRSGEGEFAHNRARTLVRWRSESGHQRTWRPRNSTSALPLKADSTRTSRHVRIVPSTDEPVIY